MTNAELAILTLVAEQPRHGYQIEQVIEQRGMREWTEVGFSSIYYLLKKLESQGLISARLQEAKRGPARKIYQITGLGRNALKEGLLEALSEPQPCYTSFSLAIGNLPSIEHREAVEALTKYHSALTARLQQINERWEGQKPLPYFVDALFDYSAARVEAELKWTAEFIEQMEAYHDQDRF
jgi:DNA-binding PadR family transcriptional regulator